MKKTTQITILTLAFLTGGTVTQAQASFFDKLPSMLNAATGTTSKSGTSSAALNALSNSDVGSGLKEALRIGTETVVANLGKADGFNNDSNIHIPLPGTLQKVDAALGAMGMGSLTDDLELRLNRAAEAATPKAKTLFVDAIQKMTMDDAKAILTGPNDSATQYLRKAMGPALATEMQPIVHTALSEAGAIKSYDQVIGQYSKLPLVANVKQNLNSYVVDKAMDGIFYYVAQEEAAIRANPAKRGTELLQKVFSAAK